MEKKYQIDFVVTLLYCQVLFPFQMVAGHRNKAPHTATPILPPQLSMSDMWFSICNIEIELKNDQIMQNVTLC